MVAIDASLEARPIRVLGIEQDEASSNGFVLRVLKDGQEERVVLSPVGADAPQEAVVALAPAWWGRPRVEEPSRGLPSARTSDPAVERGGRLAGWVTLVDGQRLPGTVGGYPTDLEKLLWISGEGVGQTLSANIPLEALSVVDFAETPRALPRGDKTQDLVVLANGDRLSGFVEAISTSTRIDPEDGDAVDIPTNQIDRIELANPPETGLTQPPENGPTPATIWLADGTVLRVTPADAAAYANRWKTVAEGDAEAEQGEEKEAAQPRPGVLVRSVLENAGDADRPIVLSYPLERIVSMEAVAGGVRAVSSLPLVSHRPTGDRRLAPPPSVEEDARVNTGGFGSRDIVLSGPEQAEWTLPSGAAAVAGTLVMPRTAWAWGDCVVRVSIVNADGTAGRTIGEGRLSGETPALPFRGEVSGEGELHLRITVDQGRRGPIQDVVVVQDAIVLTAP